MLHLLFINYLMLHRNTLCFENTKVNSKYNKENSKLVLNEKIQSKFNSDLSLQNVDLKNAANQTSLL